MLNLEKIKKALQHAKEASKLLKNHPNHAKILELVNFIDVSVKILEKTDPDLTNMDSKTLENLEKAFEVTEQYYYKYIAN
jgi:hypothetical protein